MIGLRPQSQPLLQPSTTRLAVQVASLDDMEGMAQEQMREGLILSNNKLRDLEISSGSEYSSSATSNSSLPSFRTTRSRSSVTGMAAKEASKKAKARTRPMAPQDAIDDFWFKFTSKTPSKATTVIPQNQYTDRVARQRHRQPSSTTPQASYDDAAAMCRAKVDKIVKECRRVNKRYRDPHFDLETDLKHKVMDCLQSISNVKDAPHPGVSFKPQSAKRVVDVFDSPRFFIDGPTADDVRQGRDGDCWLMAALCTLSNKEGLIERLCVARDEDIGVYGFVFHRDGEWISEIVDDFVSNIPSPTWAKSFLLINPQPPQLFLTKPDYDDSFLNRVLFDELERSNPEEAYRRIYQSNSTSLYFAQCQDPQETWLPLLEKCYAKAHGDYAAIEGGFGGEGIEDLTGGVTSEIFTTDILDKEYFWKEELLKVNEEFLFGCSTGVWGIKRGDRNGIVERHAYSIQKAVEIDGMRLLRLKNPWGKGEWKGAWSDGSREWTPEWLRKLNHKFGDDGEFWISFQDLIRKYQAFERTRLFGPEWQVAQIWTSLTVPWTLDYHDNYFSFEIKKPGPVVIVLSQLDDRYFRGLQGQYYYDLAFRLHKKGKEDYLVRSQTPYRMRRSVNAELELEEGEYEVRVKIGAIRDERLMPVEKVIRANAKDRREKLIRIGLAYDLAHGKGRQIESVEEKARREAHEKKLLDKEKVKIKNDILAAREKAYYLKKKELERERKKQANRNKKFAMRRLQARKVRRGSADSHDSASPCAEDNEPKQANGIHEYFCEPEEIGEDLESLDPLSDLSDRELEIQVESYQSHVRNAASDKLPRTAQDEPDEFEADPWNAAVVVGLRVYHRLSSDNKSEDILRLNVVKPSQFSEDEEDEKEKIDTEAKGGSLDVDDSAKDATMEGGVLERKQSIIGDGQRIDPNEVRQM